MSNLRFVIIEGEIVEIIYRFRHPAWNFKPHTAVFLYHPECNCAQGANQND